MAAPKAPPLEDIGFYTLSDARAASATQYSPLQRCELILTSSCNFRCGYCKPVPAPTLTAEQAKATVKLWLQHDLRHVRFSGGEPTLVPYLAELVSLCAAADSVERIAVSSNGSASWSRYEELLQAGVDDFSISLDAATAEIGDKMAGGPSGPLRGAWERVVDNIRRLAERVYVTVGVVLTDDNAAEVGGIIDLAHALGVADIRVIPAAQQGDSMAPITISEEVLKKHPILRYRINRLQAGQPVRGMCEGDSRRCRLVLDDMAVMGDSHYPCIIYLREGGQPIGKVGKGMRHARGEWSREHDTFEDAICRKNCLDVCVAYNNRAEELRA